MTRQPQEPARERTDSMLGQIFPDCKGQGRGFMCKLKKAFSHHPHLHSSAKIYFKFVITSLVLQPMAGSAWVMALREKTFGVVWVESSRSYKGWETFHFAWGEGWISGYLKSTVVESGYKAATAMVWLQKNNFSVLRRSCRRNGSHPAPLWKGWGFPSEGLHSSSPSSGSHLATAAQMCPWAKAAMDKVSRQRVSVLLVCNRAQDFYLGMWLTWMRTTLVEGGWDVGPRKFPWSVQY